MSGPKCIGLKASEREQLRQRHELACDQQLARYKRRRHDLQQLEDEILAAGGTPIPSEFPPYLELKETTDLAIKAWLDCDALDAVTHQNDKLSEAIDAAQEQWRLLVERDEHQGEEAEAAESAAACFFRRLQRLDQEVPEAQAHAQIVKSLRATVDAHPWLARWPDIFELPNPSLATSLTAHAQEVVDGLTELTLEIDRQVQLVSHQKLLNQVTITRSRPLLGSFLRKWRRQQAGTNSEAEEKSRRKIESLFLKLAQLAPANDWSSLHQQALQAIDVAEESERRLRYENILIEASSQIQRTQVTERTRRHLEDLLDQLEPCTSPSADSLKEEILQLYRANLSPSEKEISTLKRRASEAIQEEQRHRETQAKRRAVLKTMQDLGYSIREGMAAAAPNHGRLILEKPSESDYAVELVTDSQNSLVQTALVRFSPNPEAALTEQQRLRDLEAEEQWCLDHEELLKRLKALGIESSYRLKMAPGEHPVAVRSSQEGSSRAARQRSRPASQERSAGDS